MTNSYDIHALGSTLENLKNAAAGEKYEWTSMYPDFEKPRAKRKRKPSPEFMQTC
jgi:rubrerythrin